MQPTGAMRAAYVKPSWCCSPVSALPVCIAQQTDHDLLPYVLPHRPGLGVTARPPAVTPKGSDSSPCSACSPHRSARSPSAEALPERGCHSPRAKRQGTRLDGPPHRGRICGAAVRRVRGGRRWAARGPSRAQKVAVPAAAAPRGKSAQAVRGWHVPGRAVGRRRPREGRGTGSRLQAECAPTPSPAPPRRRAAAHPALYRPGPARAKTRSADAALGFRRLGAPT